MKTFQKFLEEKDFSSVMKKQLFVPKTLWFGMPVLVVNAKLGDLKIRQPTMFIVKDFNNDSVTLTNSLSNTILSKDTQPDVDGEIDLDSFSDEKEFIIPRKDFWKVCQPTVPPQQSGGGLF